MRRFTLRDLFWLTLVVGLAVGWWVSYRRLTVEYHSAWYWAGAAHVLKDELEGDGKPVEFCEALFVKVNGRITLIGNRPD